MRLFFALVLFGLAVGILACPYGAAGEGDGANETYLEQLAHGTAVQASNALLHLTGTRQDFVANYDAIVASVEAWGGFMDCAVLASGRSWRLLPPAVSLDPGAARCEVIFAWLSECLWWSGPEIRQRLIARYIDDVTAGCRGTDPKGLPAWKLKAICYAAYRPYVRSDVLPAPVLEVLLEATRRQDTERDPFVLQTLRTIAYLYPEHRETLIPVLFHAFPDTFAPRLAGPDALLNSPAMAELLVGEVPAPGPISKARYFQLCSMPLAELAAVLEKYDPPRTRSQAYETAMARFTMLVQGGNEEARDEFLKLFERNVSFTQIPALLLEAPLRQGLSPEEERVLERVVRKCRNTAEEASSGSNKRSVRNVIQWYLRTCKDTHQAVLFEEDVIDACIGGLIAGHETDIRAWGSVLTEAIAQASEAGLHDALTKLWDATVVPAGPEETVTVSEQKRDYLASIARDVERILEEAGR